MTSPPPGLRIAVTGSTGLLGTALVAVAAGGRPAGEQAGPPGTGGTGRDRLASERPGAGSRPVPWTGWPGFSGSPPSRPLLVLEIVSFFASFALPVAISVAILKYRLYEIDRIISRTLAYAIMTGLLVGVYASLVLLATRVLPLSSPVAVAAATLAVAALFSPVRRRVQRMVDRRFNRARYDADKAIAAFAARLQEAVDLDSVRADLASAVHQALEPTRVSVWVSQHGPGLT